LAKGWRRRYKQPKALQEPKTMENPSQLPLLIAFMVFTFVVMGVMAWMFAKWMKKHREMEHAWISDSSDTTNSQSQSHH
jgi:flagellar basal body-associated protein FliL